MTRPPLGPNECTIKQIMWEFVLKERTVHELADAGVIVRTGRGRYDRVESSRRYITHLRERAAGRESLDGGVDAVAANATYRAAQTRLLDLRFSKEKSELISMPDVLAAWRRLVTLTRQLFLRFPARARFDMPHLTGEDQAELLRIAREMLEEAAVHGEVHLPEGAVDEEEI